MEAEVEVLKEFFCHQVTKKPVVNHIPGRANEPLNNIKKENTLLFIYSTLAEHVYVMYDEFSVG